jgi:hypothetical protein
VRDGLRLRLAPVQWMCVIETRLRAKRLAVLAHVQAFELKSGDILGHECAGVVEKVGPGELHCTEDYLTT